MVIADGDGRLPARLTARTDVEDRDAVPSRGVTPRGPGRRCRRAGRAAAAAEDQVHGALTGVEHPAVHRGDRVRPAGTGRGAVQSVGAGVGVEAADGEGPLVPVVVPRQHQVDLVGVEQRQPLSPDAQAGPVAVRRRRARALMELDDDPVNGGVGAGGRQGRLKPPGLRAAGVAGPGPGGDVIPAQADEDRRAHPERVPPPLKAVFPVGRQRVPGQVGSEPLLRGAGAGAGAGVKPVAAEHRKPWSVRRRRLDVAPEVPPYPRPGGGVQAGVAQVSVEQVKQGLEGLHRVGRLPVIPRPVRDGRREVAEAGEPESGAPRWGGSERGAERVGRAGVVVGGDRVPVGGARAQPVYPRVVRPGDGPALRVGAGTLGGGDDPLPDPDAGPLGLPRRNP